ncbi:MAG TPA: MFS transporter [Bacillota bacterium]|nr:MFS transporter [Bacillota bacterium]
MDKKLYPTIGVLCLVPFIMVLGNSMLIPVLPKIQKELHIGLVQVGLLITVFSIPAGIVIPFAGLLSDRIGRKKIMFPALFVYGVGGILAGVFAILFKEKAFPYIIWARILQGIGAGGTYQLGMALAGDLIQSSERSKILGLLEASNGLGKVISPLAGAAIALISWYIPFFVYGVLAIPIGFLILFVVKEDIQKLKQQVQPVPKYFKDLLNIFKTKGIPLVIAFGSGFLALFALFGLLSFFSDVLEKQFKMGTFPRGLILGIPVLVMAITAYVLGTVMQKQMTRILKWAAVIGLFFLGGGLVLFCPFKSIWWLTIASSILGIGTGAVLPSLNTLITSSAPKTERGLVTCLYGTVRFFGVAVGPPLFGLAEKISKPPVFFSTAGVCILFGLLFLFLVKPQKIIPKEIQGQG